jgi:DNA polymerase III alpha subunit
VVLTIGFTDHNLLIRAIEFIRAYAEVDIPPIIGLEIDLKDGSCKKPPILEFCESPVFGLKRKP